MSTRPMVLPPHERAGGEVDHGFPIGCRDARVPSPIRDSSVTTVAYYLRDDRCPDGRHLFDVLETVQERYVETDDGEKVEQDFRASLTCVRCGLMQRWAGVRQEPETRRLNPVPITAGDLVAQQISAQDLGWTRTDTSTWAVHDRAGAQVGIIAWSAGPRGRRFFQATYLDDHGYPTGTLHEGKDPGAALRKLAKDPIPATATAERGVGMSGPKTIGQIVAEARAARDAGMAQAEAADTFDWDKNLIDQAIEFFAAQPVPFSANDLRDELPDVRTALMGSRFSAARRRGLICPVGAVTSTKVNTHAKPVASWIGADHVPADQQPAADPAPPTTTPPLTAQLRNLSTDDELLWTVFSEDLFAAVNASTILARIAEHLEAHQPLQAAS